ncbi:Hypothetical predicted protein [Paramuricea clavata]|uniref:Uncharacterized protein n=1 Tax=Paramuricea clavata TaxID=317549 RepID=A0A7D9H939_PARCT|nr:Hypothetical predicted protein [Paramuricea clavata]
MAQARQSEEIKKQQNIIHEQKSTGSGEHNIDNISKNRKQPTRDSREKILTTENTAKWTANPNVRGVSDQRTPGNSAQQVSPSVTTVQRKDIGQKRVEAKQANNFARNKLTN